jgi:peptidoglycan/xylan/chitin deacetylase (PgdA/CDA1 family)
MNIKDTPLFLMLHRVVKDSSLIQSDYDITLGEFLNLTKLISKQNKTRKITIVPTFDDGNKSDIECARILNKYEEKAIFFIITNKVNKIEYLTEDDLLEIKSLGHFIGSHTVSHIVCPNSKPNKIMFEFNESKKKLEALLKKECDHFAFPGGLYGKRDFLLAKKANYKYIFSTFEKLPSDLKTGKIISRMHIRQSTLKYINSIINLKKSYYLIRFIRSFLKKFKLNFFY